jgi:hypothetical protein
MALQLGEVEMDLHVDSSEQRAPEWREPVSLILDESGMIRDCSKSSEDLFGYNLREIITLHVSKLLPQLSQFELIQDGQFNPRFVYLCHCGHLFKVHKNHGGTLFGELCVVCLYQAGKRLLKLFFLPSKSEDGELSLQ